MDKKNKKIAVIGGGIAGISAAYNLAKNGYSVDLYESQKSLGGDVRSVQVYSWDGEIHSVDAGVTDFNASTFTHYKNFLDELGISYKPINRATAFSGFPKPKPYYFITNEGKITFYVEFLKDKEKFLADLARFKDEAHQVLFDTSISENVTLKEYLDEKSYGDEFRRWFLYPRASAAFLLPKGGPSEFPLKNLIRFMMKHSMIGPFPAQRSVITGGMNKAIPVMAEELKRLGVRIITSCQIEKIERKNGGVTILSSSPTLLKAQYDELVIATKPKRISAKFSDLAPEEAALYELMHERKDKVVIHTDPELLPRSIRQWGAFNINVRPTEEVTVPSITFWPNSLDTLNPRVPNVFVTLNPLREIREELVIGEWSADHSIASSSYAETEKQIKLIQGKNNTWYCGSYSAVPFLHETAFVSGLEVTVDLMAKLQVEDDSEEAAA